MNFKPLHKYLCAYCLSIVIISCGFPCFANQSAGKTIMARGQVSANNPQGERELQRRAAVFKDDTVATGMVSATQLRMLDGGLLSLQEQSELAIKTYQFDAKNKQGSVSMALLKGGLRTVTGALQTERNNYKLTTPVASIGVRGTHYEAELVNGDLYLAGWQGAIDVVVDSTGRKFSLGPGEQYRFAIVRSNGTVEFLLTSPVAFGEGHSSDVLSNTSGNQLAGLNTPTNALTDVNSHILDLDGAGTLDALGEAFIDNDLLVSRLIPDELALSRTGNATFDVLTSSDFSSSLGEVSNINLSITLDFTSATIPTGNLSFNDIDGEWFAAFNGLINNNVLDLQVNFASHNNNLADGMINGLLIDGAQAILGNVNLFEVDQPDINANGSFLLVE